MTSNAALTTTTRGSTSNLNLTTASRRLYHERRQGQQSPSMIARLPRDGPSMFDSASNVGIYGGTFTASHTPQASVTVNISHGRTDEPAANTDHRNENQDNLGVSSARNRSRVSQPSANQSYESRPVQRSNVLYEEHLLYKGRGHPLWIPQPNLRLPISYRAKGVCIGDVGIITPDGAFDFLFNICLSVDDPVHCEELPEKFVPLNPPLSRTDVREFREFTDGSYLASASVAKVQSNNQETRALAFESSASEGAILTMPEGAYMQELNNISKFRDYISIHAENWYKFINGPRGREAKNGDLRLVVGCDKTTSWGMAVFSNLFQQTNFRLEFNARYDEHGQVVPGNLYNWNHSGTAEVRTGPGAGENDSLVNDATLHPLQNQCLFVRTLSVTLSDAVWEQLFPKPPVEVTLQEKAASLTKNPPKSRPTSFKSKPKSLRPPPSGGSRGAERVLQPIEALFKKEHNNVDLSVIITPLPSSRATVHPSQVLNEYLLKEAPEARMSIVNDRDWYTSLASMSEPFIEANLISGILEKNNVAFRNGIAYFEPNEPDDREQLEHLVSQVNRLIDGSISVEQYLFGGRGGPIEDISERRRTFLNDLQHELLLEDFLVDGVDLPLYFEKNRDAFPDIIHFLEDIQDKARVGSVKMTLKRPRGTKPNTFADLKGHPHRLLSLNEVVHLAGLRLSTSRNPYQTVTPGTETIDAFRSWLDFYPTKWFIKIRIICMMRLGEALLRRFFQFNQREDLDEAIFYYKDASSSNLSSSILQLEATLGLCESLYQRLLLLGNFEDLVELVRGLDDQTSHDLPKLVKPFIGQLRDPPKKDLPFFNPDQKSSTTLPSEPKPTTTSVLRSTNESVTSEAAPSNQVVSPSKEEVKGIRARIRRLTDTTMKTTSGFLKKKLSRRRRAQSLSRTDTASIPIRRSKSSLVFRSSQDSEQSRRAYLFSDRKMEPEPDVKLKEDSNLEKRLPEAAETNV